MSYYLHSSYYRFLKYSWVHYNKHISMVIIKVVKNAKVKKYDFFESCKKYYSDGDEN